MWLKQTTYKPRSNSNASAASPTSPASVASPTFKAGEVAATAATGANPTTARTRQVSTSEKFSGLKSYKGAATGAGDRRASFADQKPGGGGMFSNFFGK